MDTPMTEEEEFADWADSVERCCEDLRKKMSPDGLPDEDVMIDLEDGTEATLADLMNAVRTNLWMWYWESEGLCKRPEG